MATTNPVYQVLVTTGDQAILGIGLRESALAVGQLGIFNFHTGLSVSAASPVGDLKDVYFAVGLNKLGSGGGATLEDINKSAGQMIQVRNAKSLTIKGYLAALPKIVDINGISAVRCETDYSIKIEFRNSAVYARNGYNGLVKTFNFRSGCCADQCTDCGTGDCNEVITGLVNNINADTDALVTASYIVNAITATVAAEPTATGNLTVTVGSTAYIVAIVDADTVTTAAAKIAAQINTQTDSPYRATSALGVITIYPKANTGGATTTLVYTTPLAGLTITPIVAATPTAIADIAAFNLANPGVCPSIRLTSNALATKSFSNGINVMYDKNRTTDMIVSLVAVDSNSGFHCSGGTITNIQDAREEDGEGYDLQQLEYFAGGWNGKPGPYRASTSTGLARNGYEYYAAKGSKYNVLTLTYDQMSVGGWLEYLNNLATIIAIPCASTTTLTGLAAVMDVIFTQFGPMAGDVAAMDCTNTEVHTIDAPATDGIESLS